MNDALPEAVEPLLAPYLSRQRWFAGDGDRAGDGVRPVDVRLLWSSDDDAHRLWWILVDHEGDRYQLLIGERPGGEPADFLSGREEALLGVAGTRYFYDATVDPQMALVLLEVVSDGAEGAERVRPVNAEQSNTSLVYDDRIILKVFRRLAEGANPDVEVTTALARAGFAHVAPPVASWSMDGADLAFAQEFLAGGSEGWALALTSLRDLYNATDDDPAQAGGDFAGEARRLGSVTASMHLAMGRAFGVDRRRLEEGGWSALIADVERRLLAAAEPLGNDLAAGVGPLIERLRSVRAPGPAGRVHGDFHLGQVMRSDAGWYVLDFEGEPARPRGERIALASPLKDVAGMLRSFDYAARFALRERGTDDTVALAERAEAWEERNRRAFLGGYLATEGIADVLPPFSLPESPPDPVREAPGGETGPAEAGLAPAIAGEAAIVLTGYELDKVLYELAYERAYRPDWVDIPDAAVRRLLASLAG